MYEDVFYPWLPPKPPTLHKVLPTTSTKMAGFTPHLFAAERIMYKGYAVHSIQFNRVCLFDGCGISLKPSTDPDYLFESIEFNPTKFKRIELKINDAYALVKDFKESEYHIHSVVI